MGTLKKLLNENLTEKYDVKSYNNGYLFEASLSRLWKHSQNGFILMSAFRGDDFAKNMSNHGNLKSDLKSYKLGFWEVDGVYTYDDGTTENELSVFVPFRDKLYSADDFKEIAHKLRKKYNQESVLFFTPETGGVLIYGGKEVKLGDNIGYGKVADAYTKLRSGKHKGRTFTIEGVRVPSNHISAMGMKNEGVLF